MDLAVAGEIRIADFNPFLALLRTSMSNTVCIRCGRERIVSKSWTEYVGTSLVTFVANVCPDEECQKIVDAQLKKKKENLEKIQNKSIKRREANRITRKKAKHTRK